MKAITIIQPWATLIALGEKRFETRSWPTKHRGPIAVHAGKKLDKDAIQDPVIYQAILKHGFRHMRDMPLGAVVAVADLTECYQSVDEWSDGYVLDNGVYVATPEWCFGDFTPGRYAWEMSNVQQLAEPVPVKGQQRLWNWDSQANGY